ncbi:MAG: hypothetical protein ACRDHK_01870 [Actinomycetota bacterium]
MAAERCPECLLTPQAEELLERLEDKLRRTRPGDASWETTICPRCGRLSGIFDEREGWSVGEGGDRGWASGPGPVAESKPVPQPKRVAEELAMGSPNTASRRIDLDSLPVPAWVTVREAAFLARVSEQQVLEWVNKGAVEHEVILRDARHAGWVFVRTRDLDPALARDAG